MAFPTFIQATTGSQNTASTTHSVSKGGGMLAGDLMICFMRWAGAPGTITPPANFNVFAGPDTSDASDDSTAIYYYRAAADDATSSIFGTVNSIKSANFGVICRNAEDPSTQVPQASTVAVGTTTANTADPGTVTPTGGAKDYLFLAFMGMDGENTITAAPSGYSDFTLNSSGTAGAVAVNCVIGFGDRAVNASSENPGVFTHTAANAGWTAWTVAVHPVAAAAFQPRPSGTDFADPGVLMKGVRRAWHRRRSGIFVPDFEGAFA